MRMASVRTRWTMVRGAACEWKAPECGAQWCAAQHANGKRQSAAHNGVRRNMRMESVRTRHTTVRGAACEWQASECGAQRSAARHANGKRQNAAHNGARRGMRMASVRVRHTTERGAACEWKALVRVAQRSAAQSQRSENYARQCISAGACVPRPSAALEDAGWRARTGAALR